MGKRKEESYIFSLKEIERYKIHGIAHARINQVIPIPLTGCYISLKELIDVNPPKYAWIKCEPKAPHIVISSGKQDHLPKSAIEIKFKKSLSALELKIWHNSDECYSGVELIPIHGNRIV